MRAGGEGNLCMMNNAIILLLFQGGGSAGGGLGIFLLLPLLFIFATFYFQQRKTKKWQEVLSNLKNGDRVTTDHTNATTISIDLDGKKKSVYIFYGAPQELTDLQRKLFDALQVAQYLGRA